MAIGGVVIQFKADADQANRETDKLSRKLKDVGDKGRDADSKLSRLSRGLKIGVAAGATAAAIGIGAAAKSMFDMGREAWEDEQTVRALARTLETIPGITQAMIDKNELWIGRMEVATGVADTDYRNAISKLAVATGDLGRAQELAGLAADVAAGRNMSYAAAAKLMERAAAGNTAALEKQMPWLDANKDGTLTLAEATDGLGKKYKGAAEAAMNNDPWKRLNIIWGNMREALGQWLLPLMDRLAKWFADPKNQQKVAEYTAKVAELSREFGTKLVAAIESAYKWIKSEDGKKAIRDLKGLMEDLRDAVGWVHSAFQKINGYKWVFDNSPLWGLIRVIDAITTAAKNAKAAIDKLTGKGRVEGGGGGSWGRAATRVASSRAAGGGAAVVAQSGPVTINVYGVADPVANARAIKRALEGEDIRQGRRPGSPLAVAW
jgi:hypothetical protein